MKTFAARLSGLAFAGAVSVAGLAVPAHADAPVGRYTVSGGTVYDTKTKLTWQQAVQMPAMYGAAGQTYCATVSSTLGGSGWRLPTIKELATLVDYSQTTGTAIDQNYFPNTPADWFWSSTPLAGLSTEVWALYLASGGVDASHMDLDGEIAFVRCVR